MKTMLNAMAMTNLDEANQEIDDHQNDNCSIIYFIQLFVRLFLILRNILRCLRYPTSPKGELDISGKGEC